MRLSRWRHLCVSQLFPSALTCDHCQAIVQTTEFHNLARWSPIESFVIFEPGLGIDLFRQLPAPWVTDFKLFIMSNSDRNAGHHVQIEEVFDDWRRQRGNRDEQAEERPNEMIHVRINLNQPDVPAGLQIELRNNNMEVTQPDTGMNIILISGIPPWNGFGQQQVLQIVVQHVPLAVLA